MAQLSDDCFAFGGALLSVDAALGRIEDRVTAVVETEEQRRWAVPAGAYSSAMSLPR